MKTVAHTMCICGKRGFTEHLAHKALGKAQTMRRRQSESAGTPRGTKMESRVYPCEVGDLFHMTSESRREYQTRMKPAPLTWEQFQIDQRRYAA